MSETNETNTQPEQISEDHSKALDHVISQIDLSSVKKEDVFLDFIGRLRRFNFEGMVALRLLEKIEIKEKSEGNEAEEQPKAE
jgi:hypothetical protein